MIKISKYKKNFHFLLRLQYFIYFFVLSFSLSSFASEPQVIVADGKTCSADQQAKCGINSICLVLTNQETMCSCKKGFYCDTANPIGLVKKKDGSFIGVCLGNRSCVDLNFDDSQSQVTIADRKSCSAAQQSKCDSNSVCLVLTNGETVCSCKKGFNCDGINPLGIVRKEDGSYTNVCLGNGKCVNSGDNYSQITIVDNNTCSVNQQAICGSNAFCLSLSNGDTVCSCKPGFDCDKPGYARKSDGTMINICLVNGKCS